MSVGELLAHPRLLHAVAVAQQIRREQAQKREAQARARR